MYTDGEIERFRDEAIKADRHYNDALTALDGAFPRLPELPHPPVVYDESQLPVINDRWRIMAEDPAAGLPGWRRRLALFLWKLVGPTFARQQAFNAALVDHLNRNVEVHRANRAAIEGALWVMRREFEKLEAFHARLIHYAQTITYFIDTKVQGEHIAKLSNMTESGLNWLADEFRRHWESLAAREAAREAGWNQCHAASEQRHAAAMDELRTSIGSMQQLGIMLKRELERVRQKGLAAPAGTAPSAGAAPGDRPPTSPGVVSSAPDAVNAYKYVSFENRFRGSQDEIRARLRQHVDLFEGAADVLDLGCGRGEFLGLLRQRGIKARGIDVNHEMVEACLASGLDAVEGDGLAYLESLPDASLGGLIAVQVVEHLQPAYLVRLLDTAFHKLRPGAKIVLETVNPACWFAFFEAYIRDITHVWPLHPETLKFLVVASGFQRVDMRWLSPYPADAKLQYVHLPPGASDTAMAGLARTFNENAEKINALVFSYLDYAVVAERL